MPGAYFKLRCTAFFYYASVGNYLYPSLNIWNKARRYTQTCFQRSTGWNNMRLLFALPGLHRHNRGAEVAFISIAKELAISGEAVTLVGSGDCAPVAPYRYLRVTSVPRERFESYPYGPLLRDECAYEELTFMPGLLRHYRPGDYDVTITCSYPFINWALRRPVIRGSRPAHVFVTQNGDWPAIAKSSEFRFFGCDGLVCTNPQFYERNKNRWRSRFIPNGVDCQRFSPGPPQRAKLRLPSERRIVLMVSALVASKRVAAGIEAVSHIPDAHLVVAGDGPLREQIDAAAEALLPGRFTRLSVTPEQMPNLYRSADIFLHLSKNEPSSLAFLEALACGLPVVAPDLPQLRYIVGDDEFLGDADDPKIVAARIELARSTSRTQLQERLAKAAKFSWSNIALQYREFLQEIVLWPKGRSALP
jgi:glycosyltransferase involved in cell wall biosynthesis